MFTWLYTCGDIQQIQYKAMQVQCKHAFLLLLHHHYHHHITMCTILHTVCTIIHTVCTILHRCAQVSLQQHHMQCIMYLTAQYTKHPLYMLYCNLVWYVERVLHLRELHLREFWCMCGVAHHQHPPTMVIDNVFLHSHSHTC